MGEIHEFILWRVDEEVSVAAAAIARHAREEPLDKSRLSGRGPGWGPRRVLTECEIRREIVGIHDGGACPQCTVNSEHGCETIRLLAQAWSDHPSYRSDWNSFHDGDSQISPSMATELITELSHPDCPSVARLTDRETEVLLTIAKGISYHDIGKQLFVSVNTVKNHARNCVKKSQLRRHWGDWRGPGGWPA